MSDKPQLHIGLIGSGFMGKAHAFAYAIAERVFDLPYEIKLHTLADIDLPTAQSAARAFGFAHAVADWRDLVADPQVDVVHITAPNALHKPMALAAIEQGKHVYCEKPLAPTAQDAYEMMIAAKSAGVTTQVGFNYLCNPLFQLAKEMIKNGELGQLRGYRGLHCEDYMADPATPMSFRHDPAGGGALADLGSHALATAEFLMGPIDQVLGDCQTVIKERRNASGTLCPVKVDDIGRSFVRFENGTTGSIEGNWIATGRKMQHDFEIYGDKGALCFSQERFNELHFYRTDDPAGRRGFRRIEAAPDHAPYGAFCVAPGHQLGFNDLKAIELARFLDALALGTPEPFGFADGLRIQSLVEAIHLSSAQEKWIKTSSDAKASS